MSSFFMLYTIKIDILCKDTIFFLYGQTKFIKKALHPIIFWDREPNGAVLRSYLVKLCPRPPYCHYYAIFIFVLYFVVGCKSYEKLLRVGWSILVQFYQAMKKMGENVD